MFVILPMLAQKTISPKEGLHSGVQNFRIMRFELVENWSLLGSAAFR